MVHSRPKGEIEPEEKRETWGNSAEFFLSLLGYSVGLGNILRFPYMTMRNGGGAFLIPYFICLFLCGTPMFFMEVYMGQSSSKSSLMCWSVFTPILKGVGYCTMLLQVYLMFAYQATLAWILYYLGTSLTWSLPWTSCNSSWNTENCVLTLGALNNNSEDGRYDNYSINWNQSAIIELNSTGKPMSAAEEYFQYQVLRLSEGIEDIGLPSWQLCVAHLVGWIVVFGCLVRGIKSMGKVVWFTALFPYVLIICFLIRAVTLPGSYEGIMFYVTPDFEVLKNPQVWMLGFLQIFYTLGPGWGGIITMASYNKPNHNFIIESIAAPICCCMTSFVAGFIVFSCAGFLSKQIGVPLMEAISTGPGMAFVTYPEVISHLPAGPVWAIMFFFMLFIIALDSQFVMIETVVSCLKEDLNLRKRFQPLILVVVCLANLIFGLIFFTRAGMYYYQLIDWYSTILGVFLSAMLECISVVWLYGYERMFVDIKVMIGPKRALKYIVVPLCGVIIPLLLLVAMSWTLSGFSKPQYGDYIYPDWSESLGWCMAVSVVVPIFLYVAYALLRLSRGGSNKKRAFIALLKPGLSTDHEDDDPMGCEPLNSTPV